MALSQGRPEWRWLHQPPPGGDTSSLRRPRHRPRPRAAPFSAASRQRRRRSGGSLLLLLPLSPRRPFPSIAPPRRLSAILAAAEARRVA